jgi:type I restriction enzyme S subunit
VVICEGGDFDQVGRGAIWREEVPNCLHQNHVFVIRPEIAKVIPEFLSLQFGSPYGKQYYLSCAKKTSNLASINSKQVKAFPVQVPDLTTQKQFVSRMSTVQRVRDGAASNVTATHQLLQTLLSAIT